MSALQEALSALSPAHVEALDWFRLNAGKEVPWPAPLLSGVFLVNKAKGIQKPAGWQHALSVRQSLGGPYEDRDVMMHPDGTWSYDYFQEGKDPSKRDEDFTNRSLVRNMEDDVPVGAIIQIERKPSPRYLVLGLAKVTGWADGYFHLEGYSAEGSLR